MLLPTDLDRYWSKVDTSGDCWLWRACTNANGYGRLNVRGKVMLAHRIGYHLANGPIPAGLCVCHRCDNPPCVNPAHLFLGTQADNAADMARKGRSARMVGELSGKAKLRKHEVEEIIAMRLSGASLSEIGKRFDLGHDYVSRICSGERWPDSGGRPGLIPRRRIDWAKVCELYRSGMTQTEVAAELGINAGTVSRIMAARGVPVRG